jgi:hypothetical protein
MSTHCMKPFQFSNITGSIHAIADFPGTGPTLNFSVTNAGLCTVSFGNLVNYSGTSNVVLTTITT